MKNSYFLIAGLISATLSFGAIADNSVPDSQKATSKTYVDNLVGGKQEKLSGTAGTVVTYTGTAGTTGERGIYTTGETWNSAAQQKLLEANQANTAIQNGLNGHLTCAQAATAPNTGCMYWTINSASNQVYMP